MGTPESGPGAVPAARALSCAAAAGVRFLRAKGRRLALPVLTLTLAGVTTIVSVAGNLNVDVLDIGVPVLSMHAPFEVVSKLDVYMAYKGFKAFFDEK